MKPGAILASNTSTLDVDADCQLHQAPAGRDRHALLQPRQRDEAAGGGARQGHRQGRARHTMALWQEDQEDGVVSGVCDGFIGNRMIEQYSRQAGFLLEEGCTPAQVDKAVEKFGFAMGPFRMGDLAGNDIGWAIRKRRCDWKSRACATARRPICCASIGPLRPEDWRGLVRLCARQARRDSVKLVEDMIVKHRERTRRQAAQDQPTTKSCTGWSIRWSTRPRNILEEGIASKASDIDMVYLTGYGFPLWRGGPMCYADQQGLFNVVQTMMKRFAANPHDDATFWQPAPAAGQAGGRRQELQRLTLEPTFPLGCTPCCANSAGHWGRCSAR
jgi:3-hydroxyacyl-CoA dehydrogenase